MAVGTRRSRRAVPGAARSARLPDFEWEITYSIDEVFITDEVIIITSTLYLPQQPSEPPVIVWPG
ncbi:MAG: hypothetical protein GYB65_04830 [Chloroflexi bacterium]|nr:hypothetical protein [Chloroflexota bacterium]